MNAVFLGNQIPARTMMNFLKSLAVMALAPLINGDLTPESLQYTELDLISKLTRE